MKLEKRLQAFFREILKEAASNPDFAGRLEVALNSFTPPGKELSIRPHRRSPGILDPFALYEQAEGKLRASLEDLDVNQLRDIVAEHGMDSSKLAMKWKTTGRLVELIVSTVRSRAHKGDAFRARTEHLGTES